MPELVRLYIRCCLFGFGLAAVFVAVLLATDTGGLWRLVTGSEAGLLATAMLFTANGIIFAGANFAFVVLRMAEDEPPRDRGPRHPAPVLDPVPVSVGAGRGRARA